MDDKAKRPSNNMEKSENNKTSKLKYYLLLHAGIFMLAVCGICSKCAAKEPLLSVKFLLFYFAVLAILLLYAFIWQQVLKVVPLTTAFLNKSVGVIWGMGFGYLIFHEQITINMIIGAIIVLAGVSLVVTDYE